MAASDLDLTAVARIGGQWQGYASLPSGGLLILEAGHEMLDARITDVNGTGITVVGTDGTTRRVPIDEDGD